MALTISERVVASKNAHTRDGSSIQHGQTFFRSENNLLDVEPSESFSSRDNLSFAVAAEPRYVSLHVEERERGIGQTIEQ